MMAAHGLDPQIETIRAYLAHITRRWGELDVPCRLEIVHLSAEDKARVVDVQRYRPDAQGIDDAAAHAAGMNAHKVNSYAVVNPVRDASALPGHRASAADIVASFFHWADADSAQAAENIRAFVGPKATVHVVTGTQPCIRPHVYWELEEPTRNLKAWTETQRAIAATLGTDGAVVDPPRIMRIAGTINWPKPSKAAKGYIAELASLRVYDESERPSVTSERMARAFLGGMPAAAISATGGFRFDMGPESRTADDYAEILARARTDGEKHGGVRDLAASLAGQGVSRAMAEAIVKNACPVWNENAAGLVASAYDKFYVKAESPRLAEITAAAASALPFATWEPLDPLSIPPRQFVYGRHYIRQFMSVTVAPGGLGKSLLVLAECIAMATGRPILGVQPAVRARVFYYNAEDPKDEIKRRVVAVCMHYGIDQRELVGWFFFGSGRDYDLILSVGENGDIVEKAFGLISAFATLHAVDVIAMDPLANMTESPETNDVFRRLGKRVSALANELNVAVEIVHHTRKLNGKDAEVEDSRGGSALIGAVRSGRALNPMTADEAAKAGLETHIDHFRIEAAGKNNMARSAERSEWFERLDIELGQGDRVAVPSAWEWPDAFDGITNKQSAAVQHAIDAMPEPPRADMRSPRWAGETIGSVLGIDTSQKVGRARVKLLLAGWLKSDVLRIVEGRDTRAGRDVQVVVSGSNNPLEEGTVA